jgi:hypothetical protein
VDEAKANRVLQNDLEWYDPSQATTGGGALQLTLDKADPASNHNLSYRSGMVRHVLPRHCLPVGAECAFLFSDPELVSEARVGWCGALADSTCRNKFCFTGGLIEGS